MGESGIMSGVHGRDLDAATWAAIEALYAAVWPKMPERLRVAESLGVRWADFTTPFVWFEDGHALATVGVLEHPVRLASADVVVAGIHAVATHPEHRRRGLCRALLEAAVEWIDARYTIAKLSTDSPAVYKRHGFVSRPLGRWRVASAGAHGAPRRLDLRDPADLRLARQRFASRCSISDNFATREPGWLSLIDAALAGVESTWFWDVSDVDTMLVAEPGENHWTIHDIVAPRLVSLTSLVPPACEQVTLLFEPDLIAADSTPSRVEDGGFMTRGPWPLGDLVGMPPLWEH